MLVLAAAAREWHVPDGGARRGQGCGSAPRRSAAAARRSAPSFRPSTATLPIPDKATPQGSPRISSSSDKTSAESRRAGQVRRHRADSPWTTVFPGMLQWRCSQRPTALRRDRAELPTGRGPRPVPGVGQGRAGPARSRRDRHRLLGCQAWTGRPLVIHWDETHAEKRGSAELMDGISAARRAAGPARRARTERRGQRMRCAMRLTRSPPATNFHTWRSPPWSRST